MNRIDEIRRSKGLTYQNLADETGLTTTYIWSLAKGKRDNPSLKNMKKISKVLDSKVSQVFNLE